MSKKTATAAATAAAKTAEEPARAAHAPNTYEATLSTGRKFIMRPVPQHFFLFHGQMPAALSEKAVQAMNSGSEADLAAVADEMTPKERAESAIFAREVVRYACVNPRITLVPTGKDEISPFELSEIEFLELTKIAASGGQAGGLNSFRRESA